MNGGICITELSACVRACVRVCVCACVRVCVCACVCVVCVQIAHTKGYHERPPYAIADILEKHYKSVVYLSSIGIFATESRKANLDLIRSQLALIPHQELSRFAGHEERMVQH